MITAKVSGVWIFTKRPEEEEKLFYLKTLQTAPVAAATNH